MAITEIVTDWSSNTPMLLTVLWLLFLQLVLLRLLLETATAGIPTSKIATLLVGIHLGLLLY